MKQFAMKVAIVGVMLNLTVMFGFKCYEDVKINEKVIEQKAVIKLLNNNPEIFGETDWVNKKRISCSKALG